MLDMFDKAMLEMAEKCAHTSTEKRQVGAILIGVDAKNALVITGACNEKPGGLEDEEKSEAVVHAEVCALHLDPPIKNGVMAVWPIPPCPSCTLRILDAGIAKLILPAPDPDHPVLGGRWKARWEWTKKVLEEGGVEILLGDERADV